MINALLVRFFTTRAVILTSELLLVCLGPLIMLVLLPWPYLFQPTVPGGGDHPTHPVLVASLSDALFNHGTIIHYSRLFWGGFELFQFYFPLPYVAIAALSKVIHPNIAYKLIAVGSLFLVPAAFYLYARLASYQRPVAVLASLLAISFLYTDAHVMWGGNIFSTLAGMFGNGWAFVFVPLTFGAVLRARRDGRQLSLLAVLFMFLSMTSHFYAFLMVGVFWSGCALWDFYGLVAKRFSLRQICPFYLAPLLAVALLGWWIIPLPFYSRFSSEFGGSWQISLWETFSAAEKLAVALAAITIGWALKNDSEHRDRHLLIATNLFATFALFTSSYLFPSAAITDIRIWPSLYLAAYLLIIDAVDVFFRRASLAVTAAALSGLFFFVPGDEQIDRSQNWFRANNEGVEHRLAWKDYKAIVDLLSTLPPSRVSFESDGDNNGRLGSVRMFEMLPALTPHETIEGGIVNSASFAAIPYFLQCLTSSTCAGWPRGVIVPEQDLARSVEYMRALGISYHIASKRQNRAAFAALPGMTKLYEGEHLALFQLGPKPPMVEVYDGPPATVVSHHVKHLMQLLPRLDSTREALFAFFDDEHAALPTGWTPLTTRNLINYYVDQWSTGRHVLDRGWTDAEKNQKSLHTFIFPDDCERVDLSSTLIPIFSVADRALDPDHLFQPAERYSRCVFAPLLAPNAAEHPLAMHVTSYDTEVADAASGWRPSFGENSPSVTTVESPLSPGGEATALLRFTPTGAAKIHYISIEKQTGDPLSARLPGEGVVTLPNRITDQCKVELNTWFHRMTLRTSCVGKPHLIKYSYYPKWRSEVPITLGTNGFMIVVPKSEVTELVHRTGTVEKVGYSLTWIAAIATLALVIQRILQLFRSLFRGTRL